MTMPRAITIISLYASSVQTRTRRRTFFFTRMKIDSRLAKLRGSTDDDGLTFYIKTWADKS